jgi:hypothetical protein
MNAGERAAAPQACLGHGTKQRAGEGVYVVRGPIAVDTRACSQVQPLSILQIDVSPRS